MNMVERESHALDFSVPCPGGTDTGKFLFSGSRWYFDDVNKRFVDMSVVYDTAWRFSLVRAMRNELPGVCQSAMLAHCLCVMNDNPKKYDVQNDAYSDFKACCQALRLGMSQSWPTELGKLALCYIGKSCLFHMDDSVYLYNVQLGDEDTFREQYRNVSWDGDFLVGDK